MPIPSSFPIDAAFVAPPFWYIMGVGMSLPAAAVWMVFLFSEPCNKPSNCPHAAAMSPVYHSSQQTKLGHLHKKGHAQNIDII